MSQAGWTDRSMLDRYVWDLAASGASRKLGGSTSAASDAARSTLRGWRVRPMSPRGGKAGVDTCSHGADTQAGPPLPMVEVLNRKDLTWTGSETWKA